MNLKRRLLALFYFDHRILEVYSSLALLFWATVMATLVVPIKGLSSISFFQSYVLIIALSCMVSLVGVCTSLVSGFETERTLRLRFIGSLVSSTSWILFAGYAWITLNPISAIVGTMITAMELIVFISINMTIQLRQSAMEKLGFR